MPKIYRNMSTSEKRAGINESSERVHPDLSQNKLYDEPLERVVKMSRVHPGSLDAIKLAIQQSLPVTVFAKFKDKKSRRLKTGCIEVTITQPDYSKPWWKFW